MYLGELDDNLLPVGKEIAVLAECGYTQEITGEGQGRPGTTKRRQYYDKAVSLLCFSNPGLPVVCHRLKGHSRVVVCLFLFVCLFVLDH